MLTHGEGNCSALVRLCDFVILDAALLPLRMRGRIAVDLFAPRSWGFQLVGGADTQGAGRGARASSWRWQVCSPRTERSRCRSRHPGRGRSGCHRRNPPRPARGSAAPRAAPSSAAPTAESSRRQPRLRRPAQTQRRRARRPPWRREVAGRARRARRAAGVVCSGASAASTAAAPAAGARGETQNE